jgi:hypothetical protein
VNLDFIAPLLTDGAPPAESPMLSAASRNGATIVVRDGWAVPVGFGDEVDQRRAIAETVGFADASALRKLELHGHAELLTRCVGGLTLGTATPYEGAWWCPLTPTRVLALGGLPSTSELDEFGVLDVTTQFCALRIAGPLTRQLMARFCALDLRPEVSPPRSLRPGSVARTPGLVLVEAPDRLLVLVGAALAEYLWTVVDDAARRLGGGPVGADLLATEPLMAEEAPAGA